MHLEFRRISTPSEMGPERCCFCGEKFHVQSGVTVAFDRPRGWMHGFVCPNCLRDLGLYMRGDFPTLAELHNARDDYGQFLLAVDEERFW